MNIYIGNLAYTVTEDDLRDAFSEFGEVAKASIINDKFSGRSKGFGFVEMSDDSSADNAIEKGNGAELNGRMINVSEARPQAPREGGGGPRRGGGGFGGGRGGGGGGRGGFGGGGRGGPR